MSTELEVVKTGPPAQAVAPLQSILMAAQDASVDASKMEALVGLYERMQDREAKQRFNAAIVACQSEMPRVKKDKKIVHEAKPGKSGMQVRYASYERIDEVIRPIYQAHGFSVQFSMDKPDAGKYLTTATVRHVGGHVKDYSIPVQLDQSGGKNDIQGIGSSMAYARRYLLTMIFNVIVEGDDTDGATKPQTITQDQADTLRSLIEERKGNPAKTLEYVSKVTGQQITRLEDIPASQHSALLEKFKEARP
jgi:hypothetical protein